MNYQIFSTLNHAQLTATQTVLQEILNDQYSRIVFNTDKDLKDEYDKLTVLVSELGRQACDKRHLCLN